MADETGRVPPATPPAADGAFKLIAEAAPSAMLLVDRQGRITFANRAAERLFGYGPGQLLDLTVDQLVPERSVGIHAQHVNAFFAAPRARAMGAGRDLYGRRHDGTEVPIEIGLNPIHTAQGLCTLAAVVDLSERRRAEARFRLVVEASPNAMLMVDAHRRIVLLNRRAEEMFGYRRHELLGQEVERLVPERFRARHPHDVHAFFGAPQTRAMGAGRDLFGLRNDGTEIPIEIGLNPIDTPEGAFTLASIIDITERKQREDDLRRSNAELEQFAYVASHDLQEPLRMVASYAELLGERYRGRLDDRADRYIGYAVDGARRMQRLVKDLLAYSHVGSQGAPLVPVDAAAVLRDVLDAMRPAVRDSGASISAGDLPWVLADDVQLRQLLQNLVGNALKFRSEAVPLVTVSARRSGDRWVFAVADNGIGIEPQYGTRVFQMFQRLHPQGAYEGSGIGLAIAQRIVERHGGRIWFDSAPGAGTTFFFTLTAVPETR
ncbi:MAG: PAS domain S-box protein [Vicinamibacterales bacterium]